MVATRYAVVCAISTLARASLAFAAGGNAQADARLLSASPDAPTTGLEFRGQLRGKVGVTVPFVGAADDMGWRLELPALVELHDHVPAFVPYQFWRGRLAVEAGYRRALWKNLTLSESIALEHERRQ